MYTSEYTKEHMDDFEDFVEAVFDIYGVGRYSIMTLAILYTSMRRMQ